MKQIFIASFILLTSITISFSQTQSQPMKTPQERAEHQAKRWTKALSLTPDQATQAKAVFLDSDTKIEAIKTKYASAADKKGMHAEEKAVRSQEDASLKGIFTPEQYNTYTTMKAEKHQEHGKK